MHMYVHACGLKRCVSTHRMAVALQINCGYARVAIYELSSVQRGSTRQKLDKFKRCEGFRELFSMPSFRLTDDMLTSLTIDQPVSTTCVNPS